MWVSAGRGAPSAAGSERRDGSGSARSESARLGLIATGSENTKKIPTNSHQSSIRLTGEIFSIVNFIGI